MAFEQDRCICEHGWAAHVSNGKLGACAFNQRICDCYNYVPPKIERRKIFNWQIDSEEKNMQKRECVKLSPAEKLKIVLRVEAHLGNAIIDPLRTECLEGCRCHSCFQKALDTLVATTETAVIEAIE